MERNIRAMMVMCEYAMSGVVSGKYSYLNV